MRIIVFIEGEEVFEKVFKRLVLLEVRASSPPKVKVPSETIYLFQSGQKITT